MNLLIENTSKELNQDIGHLFQDQKNAALWDLAFWGHPAWISSDHYSLSTTAVKQLAIYHRMNIALHKLTISQIIGGVRGVIPNSKLAKYGDYRYDTDYEDMYYNSEDVDGEGRFAKQRGRIVIKQQSTCFPKPLYSTSNTTVQDCQVLSIHHDKKRSLNEWLNKVKNVLEGARRIANDAQTLDSWTEKLIKICLRFIYVARLNESLVKIMASEISFITDYEQLQKEPVSRIELLSFPQPEFDGDSTLDLKALDTLWLKMASPQSRKYWTDLDATFSLSTETTFNNKIKVNFLRRCPHRKGLECSAASIDVSRNTAIELLGSLLHVIDQTHMESSATSSVTGSVHRSYFPQAHGDWTKHLFPYHMKTNPLPEKEAAATVQRATVENSTSKIPTHDLPSKVEHVTPEIITMPLHFYMSVPPPSLASTMRMQAMVRQPYMYCQSRNSMVMMPMNHPMHQQVQGKISGAPMSHIPPLYVQSSAPVSNWNYSCPPTVNAPIQVSAQYPRINTRITYQQNPSKDVAEIPKHQAKKDEANIIFENTQHRIGEVQNIKREKCMHETTEIRYLNDDSLMNKPLAPPINYETGAPFRVYQNVGNVTRNFNNVFQSAAYETCMQQAMSKIYSMKSNSQLQIREPGMPLKVNSVVNYGLSPPGVQHVFSQRNHLLTHFAFKPRFMGGITVDDVRRVQEKMIFQKYKNGEIDENRKGTVIDNLPLNKKENICRYEDKVEKWLETVNKYMKTRSCISLEGLSGLSHPDLSSDCDKLDSSRMEEDRNSAEWHNIAFCTEKVSANSIDNIIGHTSGNNTCLRYKKKNAKKLLLRHLHLFENSLKLKKGNDFEGKIKLIKRYFAEINLNRNDRFHLKQSKNCKVQTVRHRNKFVDILTKRTKSTHKKECTFEFGIKQENQPLSSQDYFENFKSFSTNNVNEFKVLSRESNEFNAFPSKRLKMCNSMSLFFDKEPWTYSELTGKISSINYFNVLTDELLFSQENQAEELFEDKSTNSGVINGWTHFKVVVKTIFENILSAFDNRTIHKRY